MSMDTASITYDSPIGRLVISANDVGLTRCRIGAAHSPGPAAGRLLCSAVADLDAYFAGRPDSLRTPVDLAGAGVGRFDQDVLAALRAIAEPGTTTTYGALARAIGRPLSDAQKVGAALARNPVWLFVPCHRVVGADGSLTGYAGGLAAKRALLDLEQRELVPRLFD